MFDDFGGMLGAAAGTAFGGGLGGLFEGVRSYEEWSQAAVAVATKAQASYRHNLVNAAEPNTQQLARDLDLLGREAQRLAIIAENREYGEAEAALMRNLDQICLDYTHRTGDADTDREQRLREDLPEAVSEAFRLLDPEAPDS